ncbi:hypothetical protein GOP47_0015035, partial [Adiantum capillus-veneris]
MVGATATSLELTAPATKKAAVAATIAPDVAIISAKADIAKSTAITSDGTHAAAHTGASLQPATTHPPTEDADGNKAIIESFLGNQPPTDQVVVQSTAYKPLRAASNACNVPASNSSDRHASASKTTLLDIIRRVTHPFNLDISTCYEVVSVHQGNQTPCQSYGTQPHMNGEPSRNISILLTPTLDCQESS